MSERLHLLSAKEKETLRLLLGGHDAKSIARELGISVHTVNERLREARRKLGVTSSREAARRLGGIESKVPNFLADKFLGDAEAVPVATWTELPVNSQRNEFRVTWLGAGMLIMSLIIAAAVLSLLPASIASQPSDVQKIPSVSAPGNIQETSAINSGRQWAMLLDVQHWDESWTDAGVFFKSRIAQPRWVALVRSVRQPLGPVISRALQNVTGTSSPPGAPAGEYQILQFKTDFAQKHDAIETVTAVRERSGWHVVGYYIR